MQAKDSVRQFVRDALLADRSREEIRKGLRQAGWSTNEIDNALAQYARIDFSPPIPAPRPQFTARDVFIYAVQFTALAYTAIYLINLVHALLDLWMPDAADFPDLELRATMRLRWAIATLVVAAPVYLWMSRFAHSRVEKNAMSRRSPVRKYLTYLTLFVTAMIFLGDAIFLIYGFLEGSATLRFVLKATTVGAVTLAIFVFYLRDVEYLRGDQ
ncbi:DUF5671 domain-containing protein [Yoonia sp.]|uniref:DUF5671 domain-containing protein n=1 Tax=Yoonia sp. TaxID=2212373 RepID=UPI0025D4DA5E|nr:DUF5671 domain-containing protein [Yoonia sp.]